MLGIIDYGMGNLNSVQRAVERLGVSCSLVSHPEQVLSCDRLILPGVGAFEDAISFLKKSCLVEPMLEKIRAGVPFLGICLGMQLLFEKSYENGEFDGLGMFRGDVTRFEFSDECRQNAGEKLSVPHIGWNQISVQQPKHPFWKGIEDSTHFYFVHSYHVRPADPGIIGTMTTYGYPFCSAICRENVVATQFHPEKSQGNGLRLLENFTNL